MTGPWSVTISGVGPHHSEGAVLKPGNVDSNALVAGMITLLKNKGHIITEASFKIIEGREQFDVNA